MSDREGSIEERRQRSRRKFGILLLSAFLAIAPGPSVYRRYQLTAGLSSSAISQIQLLPNGDRPKIVLDSPQEIDAFVGWLGTTNEDGITRSAPPPTVFEGRITFTDGRSEEFRTSAILPMLKDYSELSGEEKWERRLLDVRTDVRVKIRGMMRTGNQHELARIVESTL